MKLMCCDSKQSTASETRRAAHVMTEERGKSVDFWDIKHNFTVDES